MLGCVRIAVWLGLLCLAANNAFGQVAQFSADKTSGCFPLTVQFTDQSGGVITNWSWNFGNGNTSQLQHPSAVYTAPGIYTVTLTVANATHANQETKTGYIVVRDYPTVDFSFDKNTGCAPLQVQFTSQSNNSAGSIVEWYWVFGDGGTSTQANPLYTFNAAGDRSIGLKVKNEFGCESTISKANSIHVNGPRVAFAASVTTSCQVPFAVEFTNQSSGNGPLTLAWNFGNGQTSTTSNPSALYTTPGVYEATLNATDISGCSSQLKKLIFAGTGGGLDFHPSQFQACTGQPISFTVVADNTITSLSWNFGNGTGSNNIGSSVAYAVPGDYTVTLTAQLVGKTCQSVISKVVHIVSPAVARFNSAVTCTNSVRLTSTSLSTQSVEWWINDQFVSNAQTLIYESVAGADLVVKLIAFNSLDCPSNISKVVHVTPPPIALFTPDLDQDCEQPSLSGCAPFRADFKNISVSELPISNQWSIQPGLISTSRDVTHTFAQAGIYAVKLRITDSRGCRDSLTRLVHVSNIMPIAFFNYDRDTVCVNDEVQFTNLSTAGSFFLLGFR